MAILYEKALSSLYPGELILFEKPYFCGRFMNEKNFANIDFTNVKSAN